MQIMQKNTKVEAQGDLSEAELKKKQHYRSDDNAQQIDCHASGRRFYKSQLCKQHICSPFQKIYPSVDLFSERLALESG